MGKKNRKLDTFIALLVDGINPHDKNDTDYGIEHTWSAPGMHGSILFMWSENRSLHGNKPHIALAAVSSKVRKNR